MNKDTIDSLVTKLISTCAVIVQILRDQYPIRNIYGSWLKTNR